MMDDSTRQILQHRLQLREHFRVLRIVGEVGHLVGVGVVIESTAPFSRSSHPVWRQRSVRTDWPKKPVFFAMVKAGRHPS